MTARYYSHVTGEVVTIAFYGDTYCLIMDAQGYTHSERTDMVRAAIDARLLEEVKE